jgi:hypothetical protein
MPYIPNMGLGAVPIGAMTQVARVWPIPKPHGVQPSREPEYRRDYQRAYKARRRATTQASLTDRLP